MDLNIVDDNQMETRANTDLAVRMVREAMRANKDVAFRTLAALDALHDDDKSIGSIDSTTMAKMEEANNRVLQARMSVAQGPTEREQIARNYDKKANKILLAAQKYRHNRQA